MKSQTADETERSGYLRDMAKSDTSDAIHHLEEITQYLIHEDPEVRYHGIETLYYLSPDYPLELREALPGIVSRLDDESVHVRTCAMQVVMILAEWYPHYFHATTDLLADSMNATDHRERALAATALCQIARFRPDLVTPREEVLARVLELREEMQEVVGSDVVTDEFLDESVTALRGGDIGSRYLDRDLATVPRATSLSKPARTAFHSLYLGMAFFLFSIFIIINTFRFAWRFRHYTPTGRLIILLGTIKNVRFLLSFKRAILYLRASMWPAPVQVFPILPGTTPASEDPTVRTGALPNGWGTIAGLVRERDGYTCRNCRRRGGPHGDREIHVDHQIPRSRGGPDEPRNLRSLCRPCHEARHRRSFD